MTDPIPALVRHGAFARQLAALPAGDADVLIGGRTGLGIVTLMAGAAGRAALAERMADHGVRLPDGATARETGGITAIGTGPATWLVVSANAPPGWADGMAAACAGVGSVADQSSGYAVLRIGGPGAATLLARGPFVDLHPDAFPPGAAAVTLIAHIGVILWRSADGAMFDIALFRSFAGSFWHWLETAAWGAGLTLARFD